MSKTLRIALVAEGVTDYVVIRSAVESMLGEQSFDLKLLQPEGSVAFEGQGRAGSLGGGWRGVYRWCLDAAERSGGRISDDPLFINTDLLVLHLDADVAEEDPANYPYHPIPELEGKLPCAKPCPPPAATTDRLRALLLEWIGESSIPANTVFCTPSKCAEAWVMAICFPQDNEMNRRGWECHPDPDGRLAQQTKAVRFSKCQRDYEDRREGWLACNFRKID
jgi:hypothetical protein